MKIAGIIAEYNPFHSGHAYQLEKTREAGATHIVAIMSGNFVQRGEPAFASKFIRAQAAVAGGIDLVLELPLQYAMATAQRFAFGAVFLLGALGCVDILSFGSECGDKDLLFSAVESISSQECSDLTNKLLISGVTYAYARQRAVEELSGLPVASLLSSPNDTLAIEYLRQIKLQGLPFSVNAVKRLGSDHDSLSSDNPQSASASAIRAMLRCSKLDEARRRIPKPVWEIYQKALSCGQAPFIDGSLDCAILASLRMMTKSDFELLPDISEGLENRIYSASRKATSLDMLLTLAKTKRYPLARIRRIIWSAFFDMHSKPENTPPAYLRILAFNSRGAQILSAANHIPSLPISHSLSRLENISETCADFVRLETRASDLYSLGLPVPLPCGSEYTEHIVRFN